MFSFFASQEKKMRGNAENWLELADKVWHYRRDQLSEAERGDLIARRDTLRKASKDGTDSAKLKLHIESLEGTLRRVGGKIYPKTALIENVEFFLVAAIVIIGIRTYFVQPFKIPTNSMWPSYYGMTPEAYPDPAKRPSTLGKVMRFALFGAQNHTLTAPATGEVEAEFFGRSNSFAYSIKSGKKWLVIPTDVKEYTFYVNGLPVTERVPVDFNFESAIQAAWFDRSEEKMNAWVQGLQARNRSQPTPKWVSATNGSAPMVRLGLGRNVRQGEAFLSYDLMTGDQLFVDRVSYHFVRPQVGQGFVFRTGNIRGIADIYGDQYYIKRLVGVPGDVLEIKNFTLYRNGQPITGAASFDLNARRVGNYPGYRNVESLSVGRTMTVPPRSFLALGDNSANSSDGRYWGFVPNKDAAGRPLFIYYPFTKRWGPAK